jgi:Cysteinyl-tRNA synthetase
MIELTTKLLELNFAYIMQGHVYFEVSKFDSYGKLSNKNITDLVAGARVEISDLKKTQLILFFGNHRQQKNLAGIRHGAGVGQDGILSVRRWLKNI